MPDIPIVAIVGRPNVGKSTLFNRLVRQRRAITDPTPGVTRDPVSLITVLGDTACSLVDTGGFNSTVRSDLEHTVRERVLEMVRKAHTIVLVFAAGDLTAEDEELIAILRPYQNRIIVAVNKTEGGRLVSEAQNIFKYGFEELYCISAEHGDHIGELITAIEKKLPLLSGTVPEQEKESISIAILGKPNTGKSTLSNFLTNSQASIVSPVPGTTRDIIEGTFYFRNKTFNILDTAGIRRKSKVTENIEYYSVNRAIKTLNEASIVFLMIDSVEGLSEQDKKIASLAHNKGRGVILVLNKWDMMPRIKNAFEAVCDRIHFSFGHMEYAPIIAISASKGEGIEKLLSTALAMYHQLTTKIETARLNRQLERWLAEYPLPIGPQTRFKIRYAVQTSENPIRFRFFVTRPQAVTEQYKAFLRNKIRHDLGFPFIPINIEIRSTRN
ncbi:MAG: ribosome biogenesis GTPase Der [Treponema sp.]|nr:ribosome biogenesis GTPase Der [Treponema sp.]